jgi:hypothetical protein
VLAGAAAVLLGGKGAEAVDTTIELDTVLQEEEDRKNRKKNRKQVIEPKEPAPKKERKRTVI